MQANKTNQTTQSSYHKKLSSISIISLIALISAGCSTIPKPFKTTEIAEITRKDREAATQNVAPVTSALTLEEAIARALKYNLDHRTKMIEQAQAAGQLDTSKFDMLPKLMANAGYSSRSEDLTRSAKDSVTGLPSLSNPYISSDKDHATADLTFSWNLLDFGASYYTAKQNADRVLIANERRRKAMHSLIQNVRTSYWRAVAAQKLSAQVKSTLAEAESALEDSRKISSERMRSPSESLRYEGVNNFV